jgi:hypothetical protein
MLNIDFQKETPEAIRKWIIECLTWVDGSDTRKILLAYRMENIYFHGKLDGVLEANKRALDAINSISKPMVQS